MRIGLFGGSFDPPHAGHALVARIALMRLRLDRLWWLVSPGNPLKDTRALPSVAARIAASRALARDPRIVFSGFEADIGSRYSYDTIAYLSAHCPGVRFVWIMGADNLLQFHRWQRWREIAQQTPIAIIDRAGATLRATNAPAAQFFARARVDERDAARLAGMSPPAIVYLHGPRVLQSSTELRRAEGRY